MDTKKLDSYISRSQVKEYLSHILENGTKDIVESPDSVHAVEPLGIRIGSTINSVRMYHLSRQTGYQGQTVQGDIVLVSDDTKPELPLGTVAVGIFYMSKSGRDYSSEKDSIGSYSYTGDIGDVVCVDARVWGDVNLSKAEIGLNYRLFVFWKAV